MQERFASRYQKGGDSPYQQSENDYSNGKQKSETASEVNNLYKQLDQEREKLRQEHLDQIKAKNSGLPEQQHRPQVRNIDPFERKMRLAQEAQGEFSSRKVTSRRDKG